MPSPPMSQFLEKLCVLQQNHVENFAGPELDVSDSSWKKIAMQKWGVMAGKAVVDGELSKIC